MFLRNFEYYLADDKTEMIASQYTVVIFILLSLSIDVLYVKIKQISLIITCMAYFYY